MEGGGEGQGGDGGGRRWKKSIRRRQPGEGTSTAAPEASPVAPMEEDVAAMMPGEDDPVGPKKTGRDALSVSFRRRQPACRLHRGKATPLMSPSEGDNIPSELRSRLGWSVVRAIYQGLPDFQRTRLEEIGFGPFLRLDELTPDVALIQALKERWDPECHAFLLPWGHMIPTLEDVARITGLRVDGQAVTGVTYTSYQEMVERLLGLEVTRERSSLVPRTRLQASLGVADACHQTGEGQAEYMARLTADARAALAEEEGAAADRDFRRFLILVIGKLILGTRGDPVSCRCLPLLEDLTQVGSYAWGAALLAHLFDSLGTSNRETGVVGFFPLLQVWAYCHLPSLGRGVPRRCGAVPLLQRWRFCRDERSLRRQVTLIHDALDTVPFGHVQWTPYVGEDDATQPWVERGRPYFGRDIWLHCFNTVVPLHHRLVARTLGLHQAVVEFPTRQRSWERPGRSFRRIQQVTDWTVLVREQLDDWERRGKEVVSEAASDEDYFWAYARKYGAQVYKGSRRPLDPEGWISSLEGILHSTIQQRDDLQAVVDQLVTGRAGPCAADGGRGYPTLPRGSRPLHLGGLASGGGGPGGGRPRPFEEAGAGAEDRPGTDDHARGGDGGATPTPRGSGGGGVALGGRGGGPLAAGGGGGNALAPGGGGGGTTARRGWGPPHPAGGGEASRRHAAIQDEGSGEGPVLGREQPVSDQPERYPERVHWALSDRFLRTAEERGGGATTGQESARGEQDRAERDGPSISPPA
ncbi:hypothetical protein Taro_021071 [Colocasia esculenta]|uniref:Aminotransferase-like plant mobile domain-containing protein n=1 Tax=Colocasia esculenta TaxID=4460 RepID=A0A843UXZ5_COLES|nr:hypothetical protein [Colocasia esculenta]